MSERLDFIARLRAGERMTDLCREFGISRKTGHKIWNRFRSDGLQGLVDKSRRPLLSPNRTPRKLADLVVEARKSKPTWGPKKLRAWLDERYPGVKWPAPSTIGVILADEGLVGKRKRRRRASPSPSPLGSSSAPNDIWSIDFKGQFRLGNQKYCYPLTVSDHFSRFLLGCDALESTKGGPVEDCLRAIFREYGLPTFIRSDNGSPFASSGRFGLSRLSVWLLRNGIVPQRIQPGHPEQNGRHERMHLTLKQDTTRPAAENLLQQQERFEEFRDCYNTERPHEALEMKTPASFYQPSSKLFCETHDPLEYPLADYTFLVTGKGQAYVPPLKRKLYIGEAFIGEHLAIRQVQEGTWLLQFAELEIGYIDSESGAISAPTPPPSGSTH